MLPPAPKTSYLFHSLILAKNNAFWSEKWDSVSLRSQSKDTATTVWLFFFFKLEILAPALMKHWVHLSDQTADPALSRCFVTWSSLHPELFCRCCSWHTCFLHLQTGWWNTQVMRWGLDSSVNSEARSTQNTAGPLHFCKRRKWSQR